LEIVQTTLSRTLPRVVTLSVQTGLSTVGAALGPQRWYEYLTGTMKNWDTLSQARMRGAAETVSGASELIRQGKKDENMSYGSGVPLGDDARALVQKYGLISDVDELYYRNMDQTIASQPVRSISVEADMEWNASKPRVLMTVHFAGDMGEAVDSWISIRKAIVENINRVAQEEERLSFNVDADY
jgi:hypothetical protein